MPVRSYFAAKRSRIADWPLVRLYKLHIAADYGGVRPVGIGAEMFGWLRRRRETAERIEAEAEAFMRAYAVEAYAEARRREREAKTKEEAKTWSRVALAIAQKTSKRVGLDDATRMAADPNLAASFEPFVSSPSTTVPVREIDPLDELVRLTSEGAPPGFRIQFLAVAPIPRPAVLEEVEVWTSDVSTAVLEAAHIPWPPRALGFRLVDRDGREVLRGHKNGRPSR